MLIGIISNSGDRVSLRQIYNVDNVMQLKICVGNEAPMTALLVMSLMSIQPSHDINHVWKSDCVLQLSHAESTRILSSHRKAPGKGPSLGLLLRLGAMDQCSTVQMRSVQEDGISQNSHQSITCALSRQADTISNYALNLGGIMEVSPGF